MTSNKNHIDLQKVDAQSKAFFANGTFVWEKTEEMVWAEILTNIQAKSKIRTVNFKAIGMAVAAVLILLIASVAFMKLYTKSHITPAGKHLLAELPDGSTVNMNAESSITYHPYWWRFERTVEFEGEAIFEVEKGNKFSVISANGTTEVLGTSFNIYSRKQIYKVVCLTGRVRVTSKQNKQVILEPNDKVEIRPNGKIEVQKGIETFKEISWRDNIFLFTATPVREVFEEIKRQYGVSINLESDDYSLYTGNFTRDQDVEDILGYVCPALGLEFKRAAKNQYQIYPSTE